MAFLATLVICSSSALREAIWSSFSRVISSSGKVARISTSARISKPRRRSGFITSMDTLKLLLPESARIWPPTRSISACSVSASREAVPFVRVRAARAVMPLVSGVSVRRPPRNTATAVTSGSLWSAHTRTRRPFGSVVVSIRLGPGACAARGARASEPRGLSEVTVRADSLRYSRATRRTSPTSTRPICARYSDPRSGLRASSQLPPMSEARPRAVARVFSWSARMLLRAFDTSSSFAGCSR